MSRPKKRLDVILVESGLAPSRQRARALIMSGKILVNDQPIDKPGATLSEADRIAVKGADMPYVSRGGLKLEAALDAFGIDPSGSICLDVGASTGGFTDCLLQRGAETVFALDVGYGQLAWKLRNDPRVVVIERTNIRHLSSDTLPRKVDLATVDVSFISLRIVVPCVVPFLRKDASILALVKPQFEVGKEKVPKGGVVRDEKLHRKVIEELSGFFSGVGMPVRSVCPSPILGPKGNREFFIHLKS